MSKHAQCTTPHGGSEVVDGESQSEDKETEWDDCCASLLDKLQKVPNSVFAWPHKLMQNQPSTCKSASCTTQRTSVQQVESGSSKKNHWLYLPRPCSVMPVEKSSLSRSQYSGPISSQENTYLEAKERFKTKEKCEQCWGISQWERAHSCRTLRWLTPGNASGSSSERWKGRIPHYCNSPRRHRARKIILHNWDFLTWLTLSRLYTMWQNLQHLQPVL